MSFHTGKCHRNLIDFFDDPKNWGETSVASGRPWRMEELRLKSNADLHELWYILLKERNMLMTMEEEHYRCLERMPNPERFEKVEESMENLLLVIEERNRAEAELENGEWIGPQVVDSLDVLGRPVKKLTSEHEEPRCADRSAQADELMWSEKTVELLRLERERRATRRREHQRRERYTSRMARWQKLDYLSESSG
ncbi:unnamed protein product [Echinostoma caproni]|uniref:Large ribosomal subunit protein uL29m n=1 Tax=Echinostoma caproni TaxID=27848 RepID=A0A183B1Y4_9TREM|nr:unnamed protein product [Echinostoma caproni]